MRPRSAVHHRCEHGIGPREGLAAACSWLGDAASASGLVETRTVSLLTVAEMDKALGEDVRYRPPGG
jgi:hypothetical protein